MFLISKHLHLLIQVICFIIYNREKLNCTFIAVLFLGENKILCGSEVSLINMRVEEYTTSQGITTEHPSSRKQSCWVKFTIHFESVLSKLGSKFYCCEHTNWWTAVAYMKRRLASILNCQCAETCVRGLSEWATSLRASAQSTCSFFSKK